jgi:transcriptional regulator with XRE-family HTH domain
MTNTKDIIMKLKAVREEKGLSYTDILDLLEKNGDFLSKSTLSRVFAEGSEEIRFRYEDTIRPIANALLDIETIEDTDDMDTKAMKSLLKYKIQRIEELEQKVEHLETALDKEKIKYHDKLDEERELYNRRVDFLKEQISLKDKRMDQLLEAVFEKDKQHKEMLEKLLACSKCKNMEGIK